MTERGRPARRASSAWLSPLCRWISRSSEDVGAVTKEMLANALTAQMSRMLTESRSIGGSGNPVSFAAVPSRSPVVLFAQAVGARGGQRVEHAMDRGMRLGDAATFKRSALVVIFWVAGLAIFLGLGVTAASARVRTPIIHVLSNRADLVSGGDTLVSVDL